jgi:hypothetical protein
VFQIGPTSADPAISQAPMPSTVYAGDTARFSVEATGKSAMSYQWQQSTDRGSSWHNIAGATSSAYSFTASTALDTSQYRVVVTDSAGSATSAAATLAVWVHGPPQISTQPASTHASVGGKATFTVIPSGNPDYYYYDWQTSSDGKNWREAIGNGISASNTFTVTGIAASDNGTRVRCIVTQFETTNTTSTTSSSATLSVP